MVPDPNGDDDFGYSTHSVYCDSPDLEFFWEKVEGVKFRRKLRFRRYEGQPDVFLEIKQRLDRTVQKRRVRWSLQRLHETFLAHDFDALTPQETADPTVAEMVAMWRTYDLRPVMATRYRRLALHGTYDPGLRITFDTGVSYSGEALDVAAGWPGGPLMVDPRVAVMEIKFNDRAPAWLSDLIIGFGLMATRMSKYCRAIDLQLFEGRFT